MGLCSASCCRRDLCTGVSLRPGCVAPPWAPLGGAAGGWLLLLLPTPARGDPPVLKAPTTTPPWASVPRAIVGVERERPKLGKLTPC